MSLSEKHLDILRISRIFTKVPHCLHGLRVQWLASITASHLPLHDYDRLHAATIERHSKRIALLNGKSGNFRHILGRMLENLQIKPSSYFDTNASLSAAFQNWISSSAVAWLAVALNLDHEVAS